MLKAKDLIKSFGQLAVLKGISLHVNRGEVVAIIGQSGSGKSTLLRCLNNLERVDGGSIAVGGRTLFDAADARTLSEREIRRNRLHFGLVFQNFNLFPHMNVLRNLTEAQMCVLDRSREQAESYARTLLGKVGLSDREKAYPYQLSGGQQQRVAIARALAIDPEILCFDEPTSALDPLLTQEVLGVIRNLANEKRTMIVVTHEMAFAREVADRVVFMDQGFIVAEGTPNEVFKNERVRAFSRMDGESEKQN